MTALISAAFVAAKKNFTQVIKNAKNPHLKSDYANLGSYLNAIDTALLEQGIAMSQETFESDGGATVETVLRHASGETIRFGKLHIPAVKNDPQGFGSALTYARRYSMATACGLVAEDDDGHAAAQAYQKQTKATEQATKVKVALEDGRFQKALEKVKAGTYKATDLQANFSLTAEQTTALGEATNA